MPDSNVLEALRIAAALVLIPCLVLILISVVTKR
jgi:hypothetical protein